jgi:hypothetical protein
MTDRPRFRARLLAIVALFCLALGVGGYFFALRQKGAVATLEQSSGLVERDQRNAEGKWAPAPAGARFDFGDGARTGANSTALFELFDRSRLSLEPATLVRFLDRRTGSGAAKLDVVLGAATLEAGEESIDVDLALGVARVDPRGRLRVVREGKNVLVEVKIGSARLLGEKETLELRIGSAVEITPDRSFRPVLAAAPPPGAEANAAPAGSARAADAVEPADSLAIAASAALPSADSSARARGPAVVDFVVGGGDSFVVHDPRPPSTIAFSQTACAGATVLTISSSRGGTRETTGDARVSGTFTAGSNRYSISCLDSAGALGPTILKGSISVLADAGSRSLARTAPRTSVDLDGRRYTVLYQTLLPKIDVAWPNAPEASSYAVSVSSGTGRRNFTSKTPRYAFGSGVLGEGDHVVAFEAAGRRSKPTNVAVRFDNAAPTASLSSPADGSFAPGARVLVAGAALPGWTVSAGGGELGQDAQNRFSEEVSAPSTQRALVIRFSHPARGVHYYLKRSASR